MREPTHRDAERKDFYRRRLPHWQPEGAVIFLTWRLFGSLPREALERLAAERKLLEKQQAQPGEIARDRALREGKRLFALTDEMLARNICGPQWLRDDRIAQLVMDALFYHHESLYILMRFVIMPNHVHVLLWPLEERVSQATKPAPERRQTVLSASPQAGKPAPQVGKDTESAASNYVPLRRITQSIKGYTAREANRILNRTGQPFWQDESYDHWARDEAELERIAAYIESDPVRAGFVERAEEWRWSSAWRRAG